MYLPGLEILQNFTESLCVGFSHFVITLRTHARQVGAAVIQEVLGLNLSHGTGYPD
jgi:hypothetical protein